MYETNEKFKNKLLEAHFNLVENITDLVINFVLHLFFTLL